jgi:hypothetical protein
MRSSFSKRKTIKSQPSAIAIVYTIQTFVPFINRLSARLPIVTVMNTIARRSSVAVFSIPSQRKWDPTKAGRAVVRHERSSTKVIIADGIATDVR